ncbi:MAG: putative toxin-antitoxin system toxin component, PIN family [Betaproteobacteria bacterium]|nr:putative toxin-antitoxin system toxin component, PIN family [Betaproteobacteria bacterium]
MIVRLVLDTNTVVSGLLWGKSSGRLLDAALEERIEIFTTQTLLIELADVLPRAKFAMRVAASQFSVDELVARYAVLAQRVEPATISPVCADPDDDHVLACALAAEAEIIVSRDKDLRNLKYFHRIPILHATEALARIEQPVSR